MARSIPKITGKCACAVMRRANLMPVIASNRIGEEEDEDSSINFYGSSFIAGPQGNLIEEAGRDEQTVLVAEFDLISWKFSVSNGVFSAIAVRIYTRKSLRMTVSRCS